MKVPTTFNEMLLFNASVMGYGSSTWMNIVLQQFDDMVKNVANFGRLQEECDVMSLVLAKYKGKINLPEFKAVTLASLRSLLPAEWDSEHEVAWAWLWENIEGLLSAMLGKPKLQEEALEQYFARIPDTVDWQTLRSQLFPSFLEATPTAQGYLKQSATRINFVAEKIILHSLEIYRAPRKMVEEISAVGLRHVGYGIPTEIFPPFVTCSVDLLKSLTQAINANQKFQLKRAMEVCARGQRAKELLNITAGSQSISPFYWAIDSGALMCAEVMLEDLLTIRADRDVYYYGVDALFTTHTECIYFLLILGVFIVGQAALLNHRLEETQTVAEDAVMFGCRIFNYIFSMCKLIISQANKTYRDLGNGNVRHVCRCPVPAYLFELQETPGAVFSEESGDLWNLDYESSRVNSLLRGWL
eukprot:g1698.t1